LAVYPAKEILQKQIQPYSWEKQEIWNPGVSELA
jgi:hypothetical protein